MGKNEGKGKDNGLGKDDCKGKGYSKREGKGQQGYEKGYGNAMVMEGKRVRLRVNKGNGKCRVQQG